MSDWRDTYDSWKLAGPDEPPTCEKCGGWMLPVWGGPDYCEDCDFEAEQLELQADAQPDGDEEFLP